MYKYSYHPTQLSHQRGTTHYGSPVPSSSVRSSIFLYLWRITKAKDNQQQKSKLSCSVRAKVADKISNSWSGRQTHSMNKGHMRGENNHFRLIQLGSTINNNESLLLRIQAHSTKRSPQINKYITLNRQDTVRPEHHSLPCTTPSLEHGTSGPIQSHTHTRRYHGTKGICLQTPQIHKHDHTSKCNRNDTKRIE